MPAPRNPRLRTVGLVPLEHDEFAGRDDADEVASDHEADCVRNLTLGRLRFTHLMSDDS